jgi:hypothetical protein
MRIVPVLLVATLSLCLAEAASAQKKKLYRWTDDKGEVHYTDQLPPEAAQRARDQLNDAGRAVERVERAMTPEERAIAEAEKQRLLEEQRVAEEQAKMDAVLIGSYPTEADLARAYKERFDLVERSIESAQIGIGSQEKSLTDLLAHAAGLERNGKPVPEGVAKSILTTRRQVDEQRAFLAKREAERAELQKEYDGVLARYRELSSRTSDDAPSGS